MNYKIFAHHAHVFPQSTRPEGTVEKLKECMEKCEIEKAVCFAPFTGHFKKYEIIKNPNDFLAEAIVNEKNLYGFGTIDFDRDDMEDQVDNIADYGFYGIKIHPAAQEINIMCEKAQRVYARSEKKHLFLSFHTGIHWHRISDYNMLLYDEIGYNFPKLHFSMEHFGGYHFFREGLAVMVNNQGDNNKCNIFAGWTSIAMNENGCYDEWSHSDDELMTLLHQTGAYQHLFGLDFPYRNAEYIKKSIERIKYLNISDEAKACILGKNLARELNIDF